MSPLVPMPADNLQAALHAELRALIASSRQRLAGAVNAELTRLYWSVGQRLRTEVLGDARANYGAKLLEQLGQQLAHEFGRGFESRNLRRMVKFAEAFPDAAIVSTLSAKLSWSHMVAIVAIKNPQAHKFYAQQAAQDGWSVRELHHQIERKAFERTLLATTQGEDASQLLAASVPAEPVKGFHTNPALVFKDPYFLDFLGLRQGHDEADLESAILRQLEAFILELGRGFAFVERQKRMVIDGEDFYLDFPNKKVVEELSSKLGISGFHSLLAHFREPWFARGKKRSSAKFWGAAGPAGRTAREFQSVAFHPLALEGNAIDDYRDKVQSESQYATFLPGQAQLTKFAAAFKNEREMFYALEAMDISDLIREVLVWVTRSNDDSGDVGFADLSDGERQLLMVLGLIRVSRGKRALFLLDEPDTHLNPHWQHSYLKLIEDWTGIAADADKCHIILTSHKPFIKTEYEGRAVAASQ